MVDALHIRMNGDEDVLHTFFQFDDGSCIDKVFGCMDETAINFDSTANIDDRTCVRDYCALNLHDCYVNAWCNFTGADARYECFCNPGYIARVNFTEICDPIVVGCMKLGVTVLLNTFLPETCQNMT